MGEFQGTLNWSITTQPGGPRLLPQTHKTATTKGQPSQSDSTPNQALPSFSPSNRKKPENAFSHRLEAKSKLFPRKQKGVSFSFFIGIAVSTNSVELANSTTTTKENKSPLLQTQFRRFPASQDVTRPTNHKRKNEVPSEMSPRVHPVGQTQGPELRKPVPPPTASRPRFTPLKLRETTFPNNPQFKS